ncbi:MAG: serine/threonine-protein kinase, partial [Deltaproteobacteria bacterium]|nr:serine/threonine-protein kinase [Deltaproteobacteria bacterium]
MPSAVAGRAEMVIGGRYRVIRELATGGMGTVYEAENTRTRRRVAIKTIRPEVAQRVSVVQRFEREARAAGQLRHPNIIDVLDMGDDAEHQLLFIVEEFLVGGDLGQCLRAVGTLGPRAALATLLPIMDALVAAHAHGVVHRDLKPDNIFLHETPQGVIPKLIDFGIAKLAEPSTDGRRASLGSLVGSPIYMSPEQARADASIDARTDVWSMGVVFYEALTGRTPFEGASAFALFTQLAAEQPVAIATLAPELPPDLAAVIQRAVTKDRAARWPTMAAFAEALRACEAWRGVDPAEAARCIMNAAGVSRTMESTRSPAAIADRTTVDMDDPGPTLSMDSDGRGSGLWTGELSPETPAPAPRRARWAPLVGAAALVAAVITGVVITRRDHGDPPSLAPAAVAVDPPSAAPEAAPVPMPVAPPAPAPVALPAPAPTPAPAPAAVTPDAGAPRAAIVRRA